MLTPVRITFDSNVWEPLVRPKRFPEDRDATYYQKIRDAIQKGSAVGFMSETTFTLEAIKRRDRKKFFGSYRPSTQTSVTGHEKTIGVRFILGPSQSQHASNNPRLTEFFQDAITLGFKLLRCPRIGGIVNVDLQPSHYAQDCQAPAGERIERCGRISRAIETKGCGIKQIKDIGSKHANGGNWLKGIINAPDCENDAIEDAIAEWADGDAVTAHYGYGNDYFCTKDQGKEAGPSSVLSPANRAWLAKEFNVNFVTPEQLAKILAV